jgi:hypothetical protein
MKANMRDKSVSMLIIGKISEESLNFTFTLKISATIGDLDNLLVVIKMDVLKNSNASTVMDGRNKNTTLITINLILVDMLIAAAKSTVPISTMNKINATTYNNGLNYSPNQELSISHRTTICLI